MQTLTETTIAVNLLTALLSAVLSVYVIRLWYRQENRLSTDLPLMFGITFVGQAVNNVMLALPLMGFVAATLLYFKIRALWLVLTIFPLLGVVVNIWLPKHRRHHTRILALLMLYWILVAVLSPTEEIVIRLHMPVILMLTLAMVATFAIVYKTGRLKEVRSELIVITFALGTVGQAIKAVLQLDFMTQVFTAIGTVLIVIALVNPWYRGRTGKTNKREDQEDELVQYA